MKLPKSLTVVVFFVLIITSISGYSKTDYKSSKSQFSKDTLEIKKTLRIANENLYTYPDTAYVYYKKALNLSIKVKSKKNEAYSLLNIGVCLDMKGEYKEALKYYLNSKTIYDDIDDKKGVATCYSCIANSFAYLNSLDKSIEYYLKSLEIFKTINNNEGIADVHLGIGNLNYDQNNFTNAYEHYLKSLEIYKGLNNKNGILNTYINLGNSIADQGKLDEGLAFYYRSIELAKEMNNMEDLAIVYLNIGDCYLAKGEYNKALEYADKSLEIVNKYNFPSLYNIIYSNISEAYLKLKDFKNTIIYAEKSLEYNEDVAWAFGEFSNYSFLSEAYVGLGEYEKAYENQKLFKKYSDSIYTAKKFEQVAKLEMMFELESKEKKIALLHESERARKEELKNLKIVSIVLGLFILTFLVLIILLKKQSNARKKAYILLSIQKEKAIESDELKSSFLANMSHEIRTPMSAIMGFSSFLKDTELSDEKRDRFVDVINHSGERLMTIINDIIDISKIESNQLKVDIETVNVVKTLKEIIEIQKETNTLLVTKNINLKLKLPKSTKEIFIKTDENRFSQIFNNLINNASKFTESGFIEIGYQLKKQTNNSYLEFYVKDTGCGIPEDKFEAVFNRFSQAGDKDFKTGNGLGLSICKGLMLKLGGEIWLKSKEGSGTTFYFTLPY